MKGSLIVCRSCLSFLKVQQKNTSTTHTRSIGSVKLSSLISKSTLCLAIAPYLVRYKNPRSHTERTSLFQLNFTTNPIAEAGTP